MAASKKIKLPLMFAVIIFCLMINSEAFDSIWFVQQWPPAVCSFQRGTCVGQSLRSFTIHGLWPQQNGRSITRCPGSVFDINQISSLETRLNQVWPNVISGNNRVFWDNEWTKHGVCSENSFNQHGYFQLAINMRNSIDVLGVLRRGGLAPNGRSKSRQRVRTAINSQLGKQPVLRCKSSGGTTRLVEIVMCFDMDGITLINCNGGNCPSSFIF